MHQNHSLSLCCIVKGNKSNDCHADSPCCCKRLHTVRADIGHTANMAISWLMVHDVVVRFCCADLTICLSSQTLVMVGCWDPACHTVWLSTTHWFHIPLTVVGFRPVQQAISQNNNPHSIGNDSASIDFRHLQVSISSYYSRHNLIFWANFNLTKHFPNEKSII